VFLQSSGGVSAKAGGVHIVVTLIYCASFTNRFYNGWSAHLLQAYLSFRYLAQSSLFCSGLPIQSEDPPSSGQCHED